jgi:hypothetical protein
MTPVARRVLVLVAFGLGVALRVYPLQARYFHPDQENYPAWALAAFARGDWKPATFVYPAGFVSLLRGTYTLAYEVERARGAVRDRIDVLTAFVADPFPFLRVARLWSCAASIATLWVTARLARRLFGAAAVALAIMAIAANFLAVREGHYGSIDASATLFFVATLCVALDYLDRPRTRTIALAGVLAGLTTGFRYQLAFVALSVPVAVVAARASTAGSRRFRAVLLAGVLALLTFALVSPYTLLDAPAAWRETRDMLTRSFHGFDLRALPLALALQLASGRGVCVLALLGAGAAIWRRPRHAAIVAAVVLPYVAVISPAALRFVRYLLPLSPLIAVLAAGGACAITRPLPRRARELTALAVLALALLDPVTRALALDRLLATEDTRDQAIAWLEAHGEDGAAICISCGAPVASPSPSLTPGSRAILFGPPAAAAIAERLPWHRELEFGCEPWRRPFTGWIVTAEHPVLAFASTPPALARFLVAHGSRAARFEAIPSDVAPDAVVFEPIDANFAPLDGFSHMRAPGPNLEIWWVASDGVAGG